MEKAITQTNQVFESASYKTTQYLSWFRIFKKSFTKFLEGKNVTGIKIKKPNHFNMSGFFKNGEQVYYFSVQDLLNMEHKMLIRTVKGYSDFSGGCNNFTSLNSVEEFERGFDRIMNGWGNVVG